MIKKIWTEDTEDSKFSVPVTTALNGCQLGFQEEVHKVASCPWTGTHSIIQMLRTAPHHGCLQKISILGDSVKERVSKEYHFSINKLSVTVLHIKYHCTSKV
jgi:hypothetical protein